MGSELRINSVTFANWRTSVPASIPGLLTWAFFGSMGTGNNGNLIAGGPSLVTRGSLSVLSSNYITMGQFGTSAVVTPPTQTGGVLNNNAVVTSGGTNYTLPSRLVYAGGGGSGGSDVTVVSGGAVTGLTSHAGGSGYTDTPTAGAVPGNQTLLDTQITRNTLASGVSLLTGGFTAMMVVRAPASGAPTQLWQEAYGVPLVTGYPTAGTIQQSTQRIQLVGPATLTINLPSSATLWRFVAFTFSGTATDTPNVWTVYSISDALSQAATQAGALQNGQQLTIGGGPTNTSNSQTGDYAFLMVCGGALDETALTNIADPVRSILAARGITVL